MLPGALKAKIKSGHVYWGATLPVNSLISGGESILVRADGRRWDESRPASITLNHQKFAEGSALIEVGETKVLCAVSLEERVPAFLRNLAQHFGVSHFNQRRAFGELLVIQGDISRPAFIPSPAIRSNQN